MTQAAGRKNIATIPVGYLRFEIAETAFGKRSFQQVPACVGQPRPEVSQREMIDVTTIQRPDAVYRRQPVGGKAKLPAIRQSDALQPPLGVVKGADGFEGRRHAQVNRQEFAIQPGVIMNALMPALLDVGGEVTLALQPQDVMQGLVDFFRLSGVAGTSRRVTLALAHLRGSQVHGIRVGAFLHRAAAVVADGIGRP